MDGTSDISSFMDPLKSVDDALDLDGASERRKQGPIAADLRDRIYRGDLPLGTRLPTRQLLADMYSVTLLTMQRVMAQLTNEGFTVSRGGHGTFVSEHPPFIRRVGLVLVADPGEIVQWRWSKMSMFLYHCCMALHQSGQREFVFYTNVGRDISSEDYQALRRDVDAHRLAGLIFAEPTYLELPYMTEILDRPDLPCVTFWANTPWQNVVAAYLDQPAELELAMERMVERGRKKVAILTIAHDDASEEGLFELQALAEKKGLTVKSSWVHALHSRTAGFARRITRLLMETRPRPDGLLITDDVLVESATQGLIDAGMEVPRQIEVIAHANYPYATRSCTPAERIGFDIHQVVDSCLESIDSRREGKMALERMVFQPLLDRDVECINSGVPGIEAMLHQLRIIGSDSYIQSHHNGKHV